MNKSYYIRCIFVEDEIKNERNIGEQDNPLMVCDIGSFKTIPLSSIYKTKEDAITWLRWHIFDMQQSLRELEHEVDE